jgi:hypothetical protein
MYMTDPLENYNNLTEYEKGIFDENLVNTAFNNSFNLITKRKTMVDVVEETGSLILAHDPMTHLKINDLKNMLGYFIEKEEYEKCTEITKLVNKVRIRNKKQHKKTLNTNFNTILNKAL